MTDPLSRRAGGEPPALLATVFEAAFDLITVAATRAVAARTAKLVSRSLRLGIVGDRGGWFGIRFDRQSTTPATPC